jgi:hypothetical protein
MHAPTHEEIARCAARIWHDQGCPADRDEEFWLEAEKKLQASGTGAKRTESSAAKIKSAHTAEPLPERQSEHARAEKAAGQRKAAMAPITPAKSAEKPQPAVTGKPLWSKPHSK